MPATRTRTLAIVVSAAVVLAGGLVAVILLLIPNSSSVSESGPPVVLGGEVLSNDQGVVDPATVTDRAQRAYLERLAAAGVRFPASFAALETGRAIRPYVCPYVADPSKTRSGADMTAVVTAMPEWARDPAATRAVQDAVASSLCG